MIVDPGSRASTDAIYGHLRHRILTGDLAAGSELAQAPVAKAYGVSRGPVREAFRLLQREGLITSEVNQRARVAPLSLDDIEHTYALRVVNESVALAVSVPRFSGDELDQMDRMAAVVAAADPQDFETWDRQHQQFHAMLFAHAGRAMARSIQQWGDHAERYRRAYVSDADGGWMAGAGEHAELATACRAGDTTHATALLARHLSRAGLRLIATIDPTHDPALLRAAVRQATAVEAGGAGD
ncbi:GntR family transcriptional regulator [Euzebya sp.]|uniref:GntR family transcriptional regulator n=1 Tax=Euzebya sp. TaxID=1971409 RepID=UPI0035141444